MSWVVPPEAQREALEDDVCFVHCGGSCLYSYVWYI